MHQRFPDERQDRGTRDLEQKKANGKGNEATVFEEISAGWPFVYPDGLGRDDCSCLWWLASLQSLAPRRLRCSISTAELSRNWVRFGTVYNSITGQDAE
jgi:hypothetical protein